MKKDLIEVAPGAHFSLGGVYINEKCETDVAGLYAAGEVAANLHGANRVSGNALTETQVFGKQAGKLAGRHAKERRHVDLPGTQIQEEIDRIQNLRGGGQGRHPAEVRRELQHLMDAYVSPVRTEKGLLKALERIKAIKADDLDRLKITDQVRFNYELHDALQLINMVDLAEVVIQSAMMRQESRGHHIFKDHPETQDKWRQHTLVKIASNSAVYSTVPVVTL